MALKRKSLRKDLTIDELLLSINKKFITETGSSVVKIPKFNLEVACNPSSKPFLVCDSRENTYEGDRPDDMLPCYQGKTVHEVLMKAYRNHG